MPVVEERVDRRENAEVVATVNEAAYVSGVTRHAVNQAIDRGEIRARTLRRRTDAPGRAVGGAEMVYLRVQGHLSAKGRKHVYRQLTRRCLEAMPSVIEMEGMVKLDISGPVAEVRARLRELDRIREHVEENPEIRAGEPVFRGTRIPVHMIADFVRQGVPRDELLEDYPALSPDSLDIAVRYAELYPRRGRPKQAPWRAGQPAHVFHPQDLRG